MKTHRVLTIAGSDSGGGAGIQADIKTITVLGGFGMSVITALTAQNTTGVQGIHEVPLDFIAGQFDSVLGDIGADAAKTGMLASSGILSLVAAKIKEYRIDRLVVDPVMIAKGGSKLLSDDARETMLRELIPLALVVTPNIPEAEALSGMSSIESVEEMMRAAEIIHRNGARNVVVKGGHLNGDAIDILYDGREFRQFATPRIDTADTHGTGCTFSAALATGLAQGLSVVNAVAQAKDYVTTAIRFSLRLGSGHGPTNHGAQIVRERERLECLAELEAAYRRLHGERCGNLIPEVQSNIGYALSLSFREDDIAAFPGRLIRVDDQVMRVRDAAFGASYNIARVILSAMQCDPSCRAAMNIRYSGETVSIAERLGFSIASFDRSEEPSLSGDNAGAALEWGTSRVLAGRNDVPDLIFDRGGQGKEAMIRVFGKSPLDVVEKVITISRALREQ